MAGAEDRNPNLSTTELIAMIRSAGFIPTERDTNYNVVKEW